jgi:predicted phage terminase large subunit-like protein
MHYKDKFVISAAREYLKAFTLTMHPDFSFAWHNRLICSKLMEVEAGNLKHLMINIAPRAGKSLLSSQLFPAWFLGRNPTKHVICATYGQELADDFGRKVRNMLREDAYKIIFPKSVLAEDSASIRKFSLKAGGSYYAVGAGGALSGKGASCLIIDDTLRNRADANSPTIRKNIIDWYKSTAYTRLEPNGSVIILNTRWHEDDLCGNLLANEPEKWEVINIPAINEEGNSYWPERWSLERLEEIKQSIGSYEWSALYQQSPAPAGGGLFQRHWFELVNAIPHDATRVRYWDRAATVATKGSDPDYTVGLKLAKDKHGVMYIEDIVRIRASSLEVQKAIVNTAIADGKSCKIGLEQDPGQAGKSEVEYLTRQLQGFIVSSHRVSKDKVTRAMPASAQAEAGNIKVLKAKWNQEFFDEVCVFPQGLHDDIVDSLSGSFDMLANHGLDYRKFARF